MSKNISSEEFASAWGRITTEGRELLTNLEIEGNREKLDGILAEIRRRQDETAGRPRRRRPKVRLRAPIEPGDMERFMQGLRPGDRVPYRIGKPWGKSLEGVVVKTFPHIALIQDGSSIRAVMIFDILKCVLGLFDNGWTYEGGWKE